jgi:hypothetical protein
MKRKWIVLGSVLIVALVTTLSILAVSSLSIAAGGDEDIDPIIVVKDNDIRVGESFELTAEGISDGSSVHWDMGDSTLLSGSMVQHSYNRSGNYLVSIEALLGRSTGATNISIPVKCCDIKEVKSDDFPFYRVHGSHGFDIDHCSLYLNLPESDFLPTFILNIMVTNAFGQFSVYGKVMNENYGVVYEKKSFSSKGGSFDYCSEIPPLTYADDIQDMIGFAGVVQRDIGYCLKVEISIEVRY